MTTRFNLRLAAPLILFLALVSAAQAQQYPIVELVAHGSDRVPPEDLIKATGLRVDPKKDVTLVEVRKVAERLVGSGLFAEVNYKHTALRNGMKVEFVVKDKPDDQYLPPRFENFPWWSDEQLISELHSRLPLFSGQLPLGGGLADDVALEIGVMLKSHSVSNAQITSELHFAHGVADAYEFELQNWPVRISSTAVPGASLEFLPDVQKTANRLVGLNYHRSTLGTFAESNLRNIYLAKGYLQAQFSLPQVEVVADKGSETLVSVSIPVHQGPQYKLGTVQWTGNHILSAADLQKYIRVQAGRPLDGVEFAKDVAQLRSEYATRGFLHMLADPAPIYDDAAGVVNYKVAVSEGDLFSMGKFNVEGVTAASAELLHQRWKLREGDPFDLSYLKTFFSTFRTPAGTAYVVEQSEGEVKNSIDVTILFCAPTTPCRPGPNVLYSAPAGGATTTEGAKPSGNADSAKPMSPGPK